MRITEVTDHVCSRIPFTKSKHANSRPPAVRWQGCKVSDHWWLLVMYPIPQLSPRSFHPRLDARLKQSLDVLLSIPLLLSHVLCTCSVTSHIPMFMQGT